MNANGFVRLFLECSFVVLAFWLFDSMPQASDQVDHRRRFPQIFAGQADPISGPHQVAFLH